MWIKRKTGTPLRNKAISVAASGYVTVNFEARLCTQGEITDFVTNSRAQRELLTQAKYYEPYGGIVIGAIPSQLLVGQEDQVDWAGAEKWLREQKKLFNDTQPPPSTDAPAEAVTRRPELSEVPVEAPVEAEPIEVPVGVTIEEAAAIVKENGSITKAGLPNKNDLMAALGRRFTDAEFEIAAEIVGRA